MNQPADVVIKRLGLVEYEPTWRDMQTFTDRRDAQTADEIWLLQHPPVYTLGLNGNPEHLLAPADIPVINIDRGGQVTYHGPGQLLVYPLINLRRQSLGSANWSARWNNRLSIWPRTMASKRIPGRTRREFMSMAGNWPASGCGFAAAAVITAWLSISTWISSLSAASTPAGSKASK